MKQKHACLSKIAVTEIIIVMKIGLCLIIYRLYRRVRLLPSVLWRCWLGGRKGIRPVKNEWWPVVGAGMVICLERGADLHMAQLMPLPLAVSCFSKIQIGLPFWYRLIRVVLEKWPLNGCVYIYRRVTEMEKRESKRWCNMCRRRRRCVTDKRSTSSHLVSFHLPVPFQLVSHLQSSHLHLTPAPKPLTCYSSSACDRLNISTCPESMCCMISRFTTACNMFMTLYLCSHVVTSLSPLSRLS